MGFLVDSPWTPSRSVWMPPFVLLLVRPTAGPTPDAQAQGRALDPPCPPWDPSLDPRLALQELQLPFVPLSRVAAQRGPPKAGRPVANAPGDHQSPHRPGPIGLLQVMGRLRASVAYGPRETRTWPRTPSPPALFSLPLQAQSGHRQMPKSIPDNSPPPRREQSGAACCRPRTKNQPCPALLRGAPASPDRVAHCRRMLCSRSCRELVHRQTNAPSWIRTSGLSLRRGSLYPAELSGRGWNCRLVG